MLLLVQYVADVSWVWSLFLGLESPLGNYWIKCFLSSVCRVSLAACLVFAVRPRTWGTAASSPNQSSSTRCWRRRHIQPATHNMTRHATRTPHNAQRTTHNAQRTTQHSRYHCFGQFSKVQSGEMGPAPGIFELSKGILK